MTTYQQVHAIMRCDDRAAIARKMGNTELARRWETAAWRLYHYYSQQS